MKVVSCVQSDWRSNAVGRQKDLWWEIIVRDLVFRETTVVCGSRESE